MKNIIQFTISQEDKWYVAVGVNAPIVTQGETFEELKSNIIEAVELFFEGEDSEKLGFGKHPAILTNLELTPHLERVNA